MPLRVALETPDPERTLLLAGRLRDAGHDIVPDGDAADVRLIDLPPGGLAPASGTTPAMLLSDRPDTDADFPGVLPRGVGAAALDAGLRAVAAGLRVRAHAPAAPRGFAATTDDASPGVLTPREMEILATIGDGLSNKAVARRLGISAHTVKFHLEAIFTKLEANSHAEAVAKGLRQGLIEL